MTSPPSRYFVNTADGLPTPNHHAELLDSLTRINLHNPPVQTCSTGWKFAGFFLGPTSIAYLFYRLSRIYPDLDFKGQSLLDWAQAYLELTTFGAKQPVTADHCGIANETLASLALGAVINGDTSLAQRLCSYGSVVMGDGEPGSDEWLYGRAGFLYFLRLIRGSFPDNENLASLIDSTTKKVVDRILRSPQPWTWHGKAYLGAAHGSVGILAQLVLSVGSEDPRFDVILDQLLSLQLGSGNFPSALGNPTDELVQFCHGSPGFILSLRSIASSSHRQSQLDAAITAAEADVWKRGLLIKAPCLCHGIAGNALALRDEAQLNHFLAHMTSAQLEARGWLADAGRNDRFVGLFGGEAGRAWYLQTAAHKLFKTIRFAILEEMLNAPASLVAAEAAEAAGEEAEEKARGSTKVCKHLGIQSYLLLWDAGALESVTQQKDTT